jgi:hypothetical protein
MRTLPTPGSRRVATFACRTAAATASIHSRSVCAPNPPSLFQPVDEAVHRGAHGHRVTAGGFVTGAAGMGHLKFKIRFLRVNERHHTVAIAAVNRLRLNPIRTRVQHLNVQVAELDDMVAAYQRVKELGFRMALGVGSTATTRNCPSTPSRHRVSSGRSAGIRSW